MRLVGAVAVMVVCFAAAAGFRDGVAELHAGLLDAIAALPDGIRTTLQGVSQLAALVPPLAILVMLLLRRRYRLIVGMIGAALLAAAVMVLASNVALNGAHPPSWRLAAATQSWLATTEFPPAPYLASLAAVVTVAGAWTSRRWRRALWGLVLVLALVRVATSGTLALDLLFALSAGTAAGAGMLLLLGGPDRSPRGVDVANALAAAGLPLAALRQVTSRRSTTQEYYATARDGRELHVKVRDEEDRQRDLVYRLYRLLRTRSVGEQHPFVRVREDAEHEAFMAIWAARAGVRVPEVAAVATMSAGSVLVASEWIHGDRFDLLGGDDVRDESLESLWQSVDGLHRHGISHRALRAESVVVDLHGACWLTEFENAELDGPTEHRAEDVAEVLVSVALSGSAERAANTAVTAMGPSAVAEALPFLQPLALSVETQRRLLRNRALLSDLRSTVSAATDAREVELAQLDRVSPRRLVAVLGVFVAMWVLLPTLANAGDSIEALRETDPGYLVAMVPLTLLLYVFSTIELMGACSQHLPFASTYRCQMAAAFMNRVTPSNVGGMAVNARYLQKTGITPAAAAAAVGLGTVADTVTSVVLVVLFFTWSGRGVKGFSFSLSDTGTLLVVVAVLLAAIGGLMTTTRGRELMTQKVRPFLRDTRNSVREIGRSPSRLVLVIGGSVGRTATDFVALTVALGAFGPLPAIGSLGAVYIGASILGSAAPTPGGMGAIEAALIAGLTGIGVDIAVATPAVLVYRLITYWLVMFPGWVSLEVMKKRGEV